MYYDEIYIISGSTFSQITENSMPLTNNTVSLIYEFITSSLFFRLHRLLQSYKGATLKRLCAFVITRPISFTFYVIWNRYEKACATFCQTTFFVQYNGYSAISPREEARLKSHKPIVQLRTQVVFLSVSEWPPRT